MNERILKAIVIGGGGLLPAEIAVRYFCVDGETDKNKKHRKLDRSRVVGAAWLWFEVGNRIGLVAGAAFGLLFVCLSFGRLEQALQGKLSSGLS